MKRRHVCVIVLSRDLRREAGWRLKNRERRSGRAPGREGSFAIALSVHGLARATGARASTREPRPGDALFARVRSAGEQACRRAVKLSILARAAPLVASVACPGCAPVGPNFERPAAVVSPQFKEIKGWKIATPRANEPKGEWWSVFRDLGT